jgi:hypothetical protein
VVRQEIQVLGYTVVDAVYQEVLEVETLSQVDLESLVHRGSSPLVLLKRDERSAHLRDVRETDNTLQVGRNVIETLNSL